MPGQVIGKALNMGYPGTPSRSSDNVIVNRISEGKIVFGAAVALNPDNTVSAFGTDNTEDQFVGIARRVVKQQTDVWEPAGAYLDKEAADILTRGDIIVRFKNVGVPTAGGAVYIRVEENPLLPDAEIGDIEAEADGTNTLLLNNVRFTTGRTDETGVIEITVLTRRI
jgi:hypothetical protein